MAITQRIKKPASLSARLKQSKTRERILERELKIAQDERDVLEQRLKESELDREHLRTQALTDPLTGLANLRYFRDVLAKALHRAKREGRPVAVVICDIDYFKAINDRNGHPVGDMILIAFAKILVEAIRDEDLAARIGGDEFALILPMQSEAQAVHVVERIDATVRTQLKVVLVGGKNIEATASFGLAEFDGVEDIAEFIKRVDDSLYASKERRSMRRGVLVSAE